MPRMYVGRPARSGGFQRAPSGVPEDGFRNFALAERMNPTLHAANEGTPIFVHQGEQQQGPLLVLTAHARLGRRIRFHI